MLEYKKDSYFEGLLRDNLKHFSDKQKAQFAWLCTVRALPLLSVKRFKQWKQNKVQDILWLIFMAIDLCAAKILDIPCDFIGFFGTEIWDIPKYTENDSIYYVRHTTNDYRNPDSVFATAYVVQAVSYLPDFIYRNDLSSANSAQLNENVEYIACSVNAAFARIFIEHKDYIVYNFQINKTFLTERVNTHQKLIETRMKSGVLGKDEFYGYPRWIPYPR